MVPGEGPATRRRKIAGCSYQLAPRILGGRRPDNHRKSPDGRHKSSRPTRRRTWEPLAGPDAAARGVSLAMSGMAASAASSKSRETSRLSVERYYGELCSNVRATDDISFKLLELVPLISGAGIIGVLSARAELSLPSEAVVLVALFAATVTLALYGWERRNIQICVWLIARAADVEREMLEARLGVEHGRLQCLAPRHARDAELQTSERARRKIELTLSLSEGTLQTQFLGPGVPPTFLWPRRFGEPPKFWPRRFGKTQAARVLYGSAVVAWLAVVPITLVT
jgi:hypothetical protein